MTHRILFVTVLVLFSSTVFSQAEIPTPTSPLQPMDVFDLEFASDPQISPDGQWIVYVRNFMDVMKDRARSNLWIVRFDGTLHRPLTTGIRNDRSPRWSPDGKRLLYLASADGDHDLVVRWMDTGAEAKLGRLPSSPSGLSWSPDGEWIAFSMLKKVSPKKIASLPAPPKGATWAESPVVIESLRWRRDGSGILEPGFAQLHVIPAEGGTPRQITDGSFHHLGAPSWTPDARRLVFSANRRKDWELETIDSEIHAVDLATGKIETLTSRYGPDDSPVVSPDGRFIAYLGFDDQRLGYQLRKLHLMPIAGGKPRVLAPDLDRNPRRPVWSRDGKFIWFQYDDEGRTRIARVNLEGKLELMAEDVGGTTLGRPYASGSFCLAANDHFAFTTTNPKRPADLAVGRPGGPPRHLTRLNRDLLEFKDLGETEEFWCESSHDQRRIQGWIVKPPRFDPDRKYPLLLEIHGGPFANYGPRFSAEMQLYAAAGYIVVYTNPRGSTSYGAEFGNLIHHAYPGRDYDDLMSCVDAVIAKGHVDPKRLFVTGGSGGGVLTAWIVSKTDRFRAAVSAKPVINWYSFALASDSPAYFSKYWFPGPPWEKAAHYLKRSPISRVGKIDTPTMLLTGDQDWRTPISESEQLYHGLKLRGVDTALVRIPGASHSIASRPSRLIAKCANILAWFQRYDAQPSEPAKAK